MANPFETLQKELESAGINPRSADSRKWFMDKIDKITGISTDAVHRGPPAQRTDTVLPGMMYLFYYHPKGEQTLPYYDSFPLILLLDIVPGGMTGLNLHYLPINLRQKLFYSLLNRISSKSVDEHSYIKMTYDYLQSTRAVKEFRPCFKRYLTSNINGSIAMIPATEWEIAIHLPLASFNKMSETAVHRESERIIERF